MSSEFLLCLALAAAAALWFTRSFRPVPSRVLMAVLLVGLGAFWALFRWDSRVQQVSSARAQVLSAAPRQDRPEEFVSSDTCQACHPSQYATWHRSFHRSMTQFARADSVKGAFDQVTLTRPDADYHLSRSGDQFQAEIYEIPPEAKAQGLNAPTQTGLRKTFALRGDIAMLTGSHRQQVYWVSTRLGNLQVAMPFAFLLEDRRWVPLDDIFLRDPTAPPLQLVWNTGCIQCHATGGQPHPVPHSDSFDTRVGELGIACESCHGSAAEHVRANQNPARRYLQHFRGKPDPTIVNPVRLAPKLASQVCGQCHGVKWIPNSGDWYESGFHYRPGDDLEKTTPLVRPVRLDSQPWIQEHLKSEPGYLDQRFWSDGMVRVSGREYNGLVESPCYQRGDLTCFSCHSMHDSSPDAQVTKGMETNEACLQCHKNYRDNIEAHTHHPTSSSGSLCYNCHMPYTTYGLLKAIRSHQINNPSVQKTKQTGRPNACNLCHLDQSLGWTADYLSKWYKTPVCELGAEDRSLSSAVTMLLAGDAGQRALTAWSLGWKPARTASGEEWLAPYLGKLLDDPYSAVRYIAARSLRRLPGFNQFPYDYMGTPAERAAAPQQAFTLWESNLAQAHLAPARPPILMSAGFKPDLDAINNVLRQRNDRPMDLRE